VKTLALETTEPIGSVAAICDGNLLATLELPLHQQSAQSLMPGIGQLLAQVGWRPADINLVATCIGPGSFTGLRVGVTVAKTFAYCVGADVLGVDTLEVIAVGSPPEFGALSAAIDAQRGEVVVGEYRRGADGWPVAAAPARLIRVDDWLQGLGPGMAIGGPVLRKIADRVPKGVAILGSQYWAPTAGSVARLAERLYQAGRRDDLWGLLPRYSRRAAAEEKWEAKQKAQRSPQE
jgi:tRNA threonylcarbamoyladenosine biosynthesis protein TsaB